MLVDQAGYPESTDELYLLLDDRVLSPIASRGDTETTRAGWAARHPRTINVLACSIVAVAVFSICMIIVPENALSESSMEDNAVNRLTREQKKELLLALLETLRDIPSTPDATPPRAASIASLQKAELCSISSIRTSILRTCLSAGNAPRSAGPGSLMARSSGRDADAKRGYTGRTRRDVARV